MIEDFSVCGFSFFFFFSFFEQVNMRKTVFYSYLVIWNCGKGAGFRISPMFKSWLCYIFTK